MFSQCNFVQTYQTVPKTTCFREGLTSKFIKAVVELNNSTDIGSARILPNLLHTNLQDFKISMFFVRPSAFERHMTGMTGYCVVGAVNYFLLLRGM